MKAILEHNKLSFEECKKLLNQKGAGYTDAEINAIRNWLYKTAEAMLLYMENKTADELRKIKQQVKNNSGDEKEGNTVH